MDTNVKKGSFLSKDFVKNDNYLNFFIKNKYVMEGCKNPIEINYIKAPCPQGCADEKGKVILNKGYDGSGINPYGMYTNTSVKNHIESSSGEKNLSDVILGKSDGFGVNRMGNLMLYTGGGGVLGYFIAKSYGKSKLGGVALGIGGVLGFFFLLANYERKNWYKGTDNTIPVIPTNKTTIGEDVDAIIKDVKDVVNPIIDDVNSIDKDALFAQASNYYRGGIKPTQEMLIRINKNRQLAEAKVKALGLWEEFVIYGEKLIESRKGEELIPSAPINTNPIRINNDIL
jgi:hypothetical protein